MARRPTKLWTWLVHSEAEWAADIELGLFCLSLSVVAKFIVHVPILQWVMLIAAGVYIVRGVVIGRQTDD
jgi:hypothetical protein